ncbi:MAG: hypothetical protein GDA67_16275 [Nitrospira sp. CR1.3]|nr:hypothetical protein [Nitrospira sp. CR1.3]
MQLPWASVLISLLIAASGLLASHTLNRVDQDLRVIYTEYTLAATDLGHVNGELIRHRTTIIRAIEADTKEDFARIADSLPERRARVDAAIERFVKASRDAPGGKGLNVRELTELKAVQDRLGDYIASSQHTMQLMERRWQTSSRAEARQLRDEAERHFAKDSGQKFIDVTLNLDRLLEVVANIAGEVRKDADFTLRMGTVVLVGGSFSLATLVLCVPVRKSKAA